MPHLHQCYKCGHVWRHSPQSNWSQAQVERAHNCPNCGHHGTAGLKDPNEEAKYKDLPLMRPEEHPATPR